MTSSESKVVDEDVKVLHSMGYAQELSRRMHAFSNFAISFSAAWSYQIAARARGLGSAWTTLHLQYEREVAELLGIPPQVRQGVLLPTAYYTGETFRPASREPLDRVLHLDRW